MRKWLMGPVIVAGFIGAAIGAGLPALTAIAAPNSAAEKRAETFRQLELFAEIVAKAQANYVTEFDEGEAIEAAIDGMLASLDPHSSYLDPDDFKDMQAQTSGEYGGLGIEVTAQDGFVKVVSPMDGTPASRAGIKSADFLTAIDGKSIVGLTLNDAVKQMRGAVGSSISVTVVREGVEPFDVTLTREVIRPEVVKVKAVGDVGYLRITTFNEQTVKALDKGLEQVRREVKGPMKGLVLDLRDNPGGLLDASIEVSSRFLNGGEVVSTRGRREADVERYNARRVNRFPDLPIVVLTNQGSASAAEIVAGALQDRGRAVVLGATTFGKGSVQTVIPLGPNKGAMRLTTSRYYTPSGKSIQGAGIEPNFEVAQVRLTDKEVTEIKTRAARYSEAALPHALENDQGVERKPPHVPADMPPAEYKGEDYQLDKAVELIRAGKAKVVKAVAAATPAPQEAATPATP
ncbi:MAG: S41 family peptidase [Hyphomonadaceae bacterium]|nr:S41 family peptidase [Hyphomonadaceae bacterium]